MILPIISSIIPRLLCNNDNLVTVVVSTLHSKTASLQNMLKWIAVFLIIL